MEVLRLRQQATLENRPDKHLTSLSELVAGWRTRAAPYVGADMAGQQAWVAGLAGRTDLPLLRASDMAE